MKLIIRKGVIKDKKNICLLPFFIFFIFIFSQQKNYCAQIIDIVDCIVTGHDINVVRSYQYINEKKKKEEEFIKDFADSIWTQFFLCFDEAFFATNIVNEFYLDTKLPSYMMDPAWKKLKTETDTYELFLLKKKMLSLYLSGKNVKCDNLRYAKEMIASNSLLSITNNKYKHLGGFDFIMLLNFFLDNKVDHLDIREEEYNFVEKDMSTVFGNIKETLAPFFELFYNNSFVAQKYGIVYRSNYSKLYDYIGLTCPWLTFKNNSLVGKGFLHMLSDVLWGVFARVIIFLVFLPLIFCVIKGLRKDEGESSWIDIIDSCKIIYFIFAFLVVFIFPFTVEGRPIYVALSKKLKYIQDFIFGMEKIYNILKQCPLYYKLGSVLEYCKKIFEGEGLDDEQKELMRLLRSVPNNWSYWTWLTNNVKKISRLFILFEKLKDMFLPAFVEICRIDGYMSLFKLRNDESFMRHWSTPNFIESKRASLYIKDAFLPIMDPEKVVKNSICLGKRREEEEGPCEEHDVELLVGMNAGGKTFFLETILANVLLSKLFGVTPAAEYESTDFDDVFYFSCGGSDIEGALSRYQVELKNVSELFEKVEKSPEKSRFLVLFDELFSSTDSASAKRMLIYTINRLAKSKKCLIVCATHIMDIDTIKKLFPDLKVKIYHMGVDVDDDGVVFKHTKNEGMPKTSVAEELFKEKLGIDTLGF